MELFDDAVLFAKHVSRSGNPNWLKSWTILLGLWNKRFAGTSLNEKSSKGTLSINVPGY
jgi:hypothetical protein